MEKSEKSCSSAKKKVSDAHVYLKFGVLIYGVFTVNRFDIFCYMEHMGLMVLKSGNKNS